MFEGSAFCFDTSAIVEPWRRLVPPDIAPAYWSGIDELIASGSVVAPMEVRSELIRQGGEISSWAQLPARQGMFLELDDDIEACHVRFLENPEYLRFLVDDNAQTRRGRRHEADPWVISLAAARGLTVVTQEAPRRTSSIEASIPTACAELGVRCTDIHGLMRAMGWTFSLDMGRAHDGGVVDPPV